MEFTIEMKERWLARHLSLDFSPVVGALAL
jgi:hypothetical protein